MKKVLLATVLGSVLMSSAAWADLSDALTAFRIKRYEQALSEFTYLADEGEGIASYYLGKMYEEGLGVPVDEVKAVEYYQRAANLYNVDATYKLADILLNEAVDLDDPKIAGGIAYLKKAAYAGQPDALYQLGEIYSKGELVQKEYKYAFGYYLMGALKGDKKSQYKLSLMYLTGLGIPQDYENGLKWLSRSANQGYVVAQQELASIRANNRRLKNLAEAYSWFSIIAAYNTDSIGEEARRERDALEGKIKKTQDLIARQRRVREWRPISAEKSVSKSDLLVTPTPVIPDFNDAKTVQELLAQGDVLFMDGSKYEVTPDMLEQASITKNMQPILDAVEAAVKKGYTDAYSFYADLMRSRFQNEKEAVVWYQKGADLGDPYAQYQLAQAYCEGRGIDSPSVSQCYAWLSVANLKATDTLRLTIQNALETVRMEATDEELKQGDELFQQYSGTAAGATREKSTQDIFNFF